MSQLTLWEGPASSAASSKTAALSSSITATSSASQGANKAQKCRAAADKLQKHIDAKHSSADNMLAQRPTRKRICDADNSRREAVRLERIQETLRRLAEMHESGTITVDLSDLTSRGAIESALYTSSVTSAIRVLYDSISLTENKAARILRLTREALLKKLPGFFPTTDDLAKQLIALACLSPGLRMLEPSAGTGNLIDIARQHHAGMHVSYCEVNILLMDILRDKYEGLADVRFLGRDFFDLDSRDTQNRFDRVIMNPPFESGQDADHVRHAFSFLKPEGILVSIVSSGLLSREDRKASSFREFLKTHNALVKDVPAGAFKSSGTEIATKIVRIQSPNLMSGQLHSGRHG